MRGEAKKKKKRKNDEKDPWKKGEGAADFYCYSVVLCATCFAQGNLCCAGGEVKRNGQTKRWCDGSILPYSLPRRRLLSPLCACLPFPPLPSPQYGGEPLSEKKKSTPPLLVRFLPFFPTRHPIRFPHLAPG